MSHDVWELIFVIVAALGLLLQAFILLALYLAVRPVITVGKEIMELAKQPLRDAGEIVASSKEPVREIWGNITQVSRTVRAQTMNVDAFVTDAIERARFQVVRIDQATSGILEKLADTADKTTRVIALPIREVAALGKGVRKGLDTLFSHRPNSYR
jgi:hypothetical protein